MTDSPGGQPAIHRPLRYVALGDSYTIGTAVSAEERWPDQLVHRLAVGAAAVGRERPLELVGNPAVNGYTTRDVVTDELPLLDELRPELISLLIGTNDVIQGIGEAGYRRNLGAILAELVARVGAARVFGVTSPDYTVSPAGADYGDPAARSAEIRRYNAIFSETLAALGVPVVDVLDISLGARHDRSLVAADGLHPSGRQYGLWVDRIEPAVRRLLAVP